MQPSPLTKTCCQCEACKPAASFLRCPKSDDGLTARCIACVLANSARDRAEREARRLPPSALGASRPVLATRVAAGVAKRRQRSNLTTSRSERTAAHG